MRMITRIKLIAMGTLVAVSLFIAFAVGHAWQWFTCLALVFSWFGDALLAHWPPLAKRIGAVDPFVAGMGAFALAQIAYIIGFSRAIAGMPALHMNLPGFMLGGEVLPLVLPVYILAGVLYWVWMVMRARRPRDIKGLALVYCVLLTAMGAFACAAAFTGRVLVWPLILGGILFIVSDACIAAHVFADRIPNPLYYELAVWGTYLPAQILLVIGTSWLY